MGHIGHKNRHYLRKYDINKIGHDEKIATHHF